MVKLRTTSLSSPITHHRHQMAMGTGMGTEMETGMAMDHHRQVPKKALAAMM
jgi:hypothetical protein